MKFTLTLLLASLSALTLHAATPTSEENAAVAQWAKSSTVGPDLTGIGTQRDREYLLRAIVNPGADIATGFEFATLQLKDGSTIVGIIRQESPTALQVEVAEAGVMKQREVLKADVKQRTSTSAMPPLVSLMSRHELRDLVEYIATQTTTPSKSNTSP